jgi:ATPase subunit of ABC transporter with duplicated ATPase domains
MNGPTLVSAKDLSYATPDGRVLARGISFNLEDGDCLVVGGPNGSGKSTLLRVLLGRANASSGALSMHVARGKTAILPQLQNNDFHLPLTLRDLLEISVGASVGADEIARIGLLEPAHLSLAWNTASGGEKKRALLTRLLLQSPSLLLLDEPMNHLDRESRERVTKAVSNFLRGHGEKTPRAVVMVSHEGTLDAPVVDSSSAVVKKLLLGGANS